MSDTLQEREWCDDCHGYTHMPYCPSSESAKEVAECQSDHPWNNCPKCGIGICGEHMTAWLNHQPHQPAARGGGERIKVELINGVEGQCVSVNDYRICGPKPWGGGSVAKSWTTDKNDILRAFLTPDQKHAWLADDLQVVSVKQHQSLVAERERLERMLAAVVNAHYGLAYRSIGSGDGIPEKEAAEIGRWWLDYTASDA